MKLAILFWFYKDVPLCAERLDALRALNPDTPIYGLYGGTVEDAAAARALGPMFDDLYLFTETRDAHWKWLNGDRVIAAWMRDRGRDLAWDTVVLVQWDMLVAAPVDALFGSLRKGELVLSGFRPMAEVEDWWGWAGRRDADKASMLETFREDLELRRGYGGPLWCCLFIVVCLPRSFLARYAEAGPPEAGFLEYRMPTLARVWDTPVRTDLGFDPWWAADPATRDAPASARVLNAVGREVSPETVEAELADPAGRRIFHPYTGPLPDSLRPRPVVRADDRGEGSSAARELEA